MRLKRAKPGDFLKITLENSLWSYGRVMNEGRMAFYDVITSEELAVDSITKFPIIFYAIMMRYTFNGRTWDIIGYLPLEDYLKKNPLFLHNQSDIDSGEYIGTTDWEDRIPVDYETAKNLEILSIYEPVDAEERLNDHFTGRINIYAEMMRIVK